MFDESNVDWGARPIIENMYDLDNPDWFNPDSVKLIRYGEKSFHDKYAQLHILYGKDKNTTQTEWVNVYIFYVMD